MNDALPWISAVLALVAIAVAIWQGTLSRAQLTLAQGTNDRTKDALTEIRQLTEENRRITTELKADFDARIGRVFDQYLSELQRRADIEQRAADAKHEDDRTSSDMAQRTMLWLGKMFAEATPPSGPPDPQALDTPFDEPFDDDA